MAGLYIHIPFCKQACHYCDFHFSTSLDREQEMIDALNQEMALQKNYLGLEPIDTIYFGGGTPSLLSDPQLQSLLDSIKKNYVFSPGEITLEANPDDLTEENLRIFIKAGINRLSIGIQSFDERILKFLNRAHSSTDAIHCVDLARKVGFGNISIDLIYSIPGQDHTLLRKNIEKAIAISPDHISAYSLTIEEKTVFGNWQKKGKLKSNTEDIAATQMEMLMDMLGDAAYEQYEISNFCRPGFYSQHNSSYWQQKKYLGIGPSAHSYNGFSRQYNVSNNPLYIKSIHQGHVPFELETLSRANKINEYLFTTLRTVWGCDLNFLLYQLDFDLMKENRKEVDTFHANGLIEKRENFILLTRKGKLFADKIAADLFLNE